MELGELETFLAVARERNFSRAAEKLYRTQPAVSIAIRKLEEWAGQPLFERGAREVKLTDAGELLVEYAERILNMREETRKGIEELRHLERGQLPATRQCLVWRATARTPSRSPSEAIGNPASIMSTPRFSS